MLFLLRGLCEKCGMLDVGGGMADVGCLMSDGGFGLWPLTFAF